MRSVGAYEAKTHLSALLDAVERGETIEITRHGKPIARLGPSTPAPGTGNRGVIEAMRRLARENPTGITADEIVTQIRTACEERASQIADAAEGRPMPDARTQT